MAACMTTSGGCIQASAVAKHRKLVGRTGHRESIYRAAVHLMQIESHRIDLPEGPRHSGIKSRKTDDRRLSWETKVRYCKR